MPLILVTTQAPLCDVFTAALKSTAIEQFADSMSAIPALLKGVSGSKAPLLVIDLATIPDAPQLIHFLRSSPSTAKVPVLAIGAASDFGVLEPAALAALTDLVQTPISGIELAAIIAKHSTKN